MTTCTCSQDGFNGSVDTYQCPQHDPHMSYQTELEGMEITVEGTIGEYELRLDIVEFPDGTQKNKPEGYAEGYNQGLQDSLPIIERAVEAERERIGKDLHDTLWNEDGSLKKHNVTDIVSSVSHYFITPLPDKE